MADKTYVPGLDEDYAPKQSEAKRDLTAPSKRDLHSSPSASSKEGTVVPGLDEDDSPRGRATSSAMRGMSLKNKPIVGFLYSVSKTSFGEFWPLYLGPNSIGTARDADIILEEATVSAEHALITIHKDEDPEEVFAVLEDTHSTNGIKLNGKSIRFERVECKNMDIIKIGKAYEFLLILIDAGKLGLTAASNFVEIQKTSSSGMQSKRIISREGGPAPVSPSTDVKRRLSTPGSERTRSTDFTEEEPGGTRLR